jgi:hypothetical protein
MIADEVSMNRKAVLFVLTEELGIRRICAKTVAMNGPGSSVGIAPDHRLDGPGIVSRWGRDFSHTFKTALGPTRPPLQWVPGLSRR